MIESISFSNTATFTDEIQTLDGSSQFNYFFGSNGTGKTTIYRHISDEFSLPYFSIRWKGNSLLESPVKNQDFLENDFNQYAHLKGVFTQGEQQVGTLEKNEAVLMEAIEGKSHV